MKTTRIALLALALAGAGVFAGTETRPAAAQISAGIHIGPSGHARVDLGFFYDDLASYGSWVERPSYGWVWSPRITRANWRPYQYGHWAWTDYGWTWISDEPFGWATYHYGRWYDDPNYGWEWVPGNEWAPSYVSWQEGDDYIGWAPLPPSVSIRTGFLNVSLAPADYLFVPESRFLDTRVYSYAVPRQDCERIYRQTRNFTNYRYEGNRVFAAGVPVDRVQRVIGRNVPRYQVADQGWNQRHQNRFSGNRVAMFRPQVERGRVAPPSARPLARNSVVSANQVRQNRQFRQEVAGQQGRFNRQQQAQIGRQQLQNQGRLNRQQQQIARQQLQNQGRLNRQQQQIARQQLQNQGRNQGRGQQQQVLRQERQAQNQERFNRQQQARIDRQAQNQARNQGRWQQQQAQRQERQVQNQERFNRQQQARIDRQAQNQARNQGRWQQQQAQRQERQMARQQNAAPRWQGRQQQEQARPQQQRPQRQMNENRGGGRGNGGGGRPQGNNRGNRHGRDGNG